MTFKTCIKLALPEPILEPVRQIYTKIRKKREIRLIRKMPEFYSKRVYEIRNLKRPLNVVFFALMDSVWKYDTLYRMMEADDRFNPVVLVCPIVNYGKDNMILNMDKCYNLFKSKSYNVVRSYEKSTNKYIDVRKVLSPDVIFYTNPYKGLIDNRYYITNFLDILTCYSSYFFTMTPLNELTDTLLHNLVWKRYVENEYMMNEAKTNNRNYGENCINVGYPGFDSLNRHRIVLDDPWKIKDRSIKRLIWAPHHTVSSDAQVYYSTFLDYCEFMFEITKKYHKYIQICFKPHPLLKNRLEMLWGKEKTVEYYERWRNLDNGMLNDGAYEDLFLTSDAMIHDSSSFIGEYLVTGKPAIYLTNNSSYKERFNDIGLACLDMHYIASSKDEIEKTLINIIEGNDPIIEERKRFIDNVLLPKNGKLASENIIENLVTELLSA